MVTSKPRAWVVYRLGPGHPHAGNHVVCSQAEWDALDRAVPGMHTLVMGLIPSEGLAEQLARSFQPPPQAATPARRAVYDILRERASR